MAKATLSSYRELSVWQQAVELAIMVYRLTEKFPRHEKFGLSSQAQRAAVSISANIAEGYSRAHRGDYLRFLSIAKGSSAELETHLIIASRLSYASTAEFLSVRNRLDAVGKMLSSLMLALQKPTQ